MRCRAVRACVAELYRHPPPSLSLSLSLSLCLRVPFTLPCCCATDCCFVFGTSTNHTAVLGQDDARAALSAWLLTDADVNVLPAALSFNHINTLGSAVCFGQ